MSDRSAALRHVVYRELLFLLPPASIYQADEFAANLSLYKFADSAAKRSVIDRRLTLLKVSPELATAGPYHPSLEYIEESLSAKYGDRLTEVAGFYRHSQSGCMRLNLPRGCALQAYRSRVGFFAGFLCQPLNKTDSYFLLTSRKFDGPGAVRLEETDRQFFEQYCEPSQRSTSLHFADAVNAAERGQNITV